MIGTLFAAFATLQTPATNDYRDANLNIAFTYPSRWKVVKKDKREVRFEIPFATGTQSGELVVIRTGYRGQAEDWQALQKTTNELSNRTVVRQWTQDLLGAPLLLTQVNYDDRTTAMSMTTGLFYTNVPSKMLFHLKVPASIQDQMAVEWQQTLESFRTLDGNTLASEDPLKPAVARPTVDTPAVKRPLNEGKIRKEKIPANRQREFDIAGRKLEVILPDGWVISESGEGKLTVVNRATSLKIDFALSLKVDSESPEAWLSGVAARDLEKFDVVQTREDAENAATRIATFYGFTLRSGTSKTEPIWSGGGYVSGADGYVKGVISGTGAKDFLEIKKTFIDLLKTLQVRTLP